MSSAYSWHTTPAAVVVKLGGGECTIFLHVVQIRQMLLLLTESENLLLLTRIFMEYSGALFDIDDVENSVLTLCGH
jgi:hypothetical protein